MWMLWVPGVLDVFHGQRGSIKVKNVVITLRDGTQIVRDDLITKSRFDDPPRDGDETPKAWRLRTSFLPLSRFDLPSSEETPR